MPIEIINTIKDFDIYKHCANTKKHILFIMDYEGKWGFYDKKKKLAGENWYTLKNLEVKEFIEFNQHLFSRYGNLEDKNIIYKYGIDFAFKMYDCIILVDCNDLFGNSYKLLEDICKTNVNIIIVKDTLKNTSYKKSKYKNTLDFFSQSKVINYIL